MYGTEPILKWKKQGLTRAFLARVLDEHYVTTDTAEYTINANWNTYRIEVWRRRLDDKTIEQVAEYEV